MKKKMKICSAREVQAEFIFFTSSFVVLYLTVLSNRYQYPSIYFKNTV